MMTRILLFLTILLLLPLPSSMAKEAALSPKDLSRGQTIFAQACQWCHGTQGNGKGPAAFFMGAYSAPRPRDFTVGNYKFRSTPADEFPTDQDLFRTLTNGIPGTMPSFASLTLEDRWAVIAYIKNLSSIGAESPRDPLVIKGPPQPFSSQSIARGRLVFFSLQCHTCHGDNGQGDADITLTDKLIDSTDLPILPTDLTNRFAFKNGSAPRDIVRTLLTGLVGTPMPSYDSQFEHGEEDAWHLANFIVSLWGSPFNGDPTRDEH